MYRSKYLSFGVKFLKLMVWILSFLLCKMHDYVKTKFLFFNIGMKVGNDDESRSMCSQKRGCRDETTNLTPRMGLSRVVSLLIF
jgi:hypothetical protein